MMKMIFMYFFMFMNINKFCYQIFYQNFFFFYIFIFMLMFPLNGNNFYIHIYYMFGLDVYSWGLCLLSIWIISLMMMTSNNYLMMYNYKYYLILICMLLMFLLLCFYSINLMLFYFFFEASLIPIFLLILGWGNQVERIQSGIYMMLYTLFGSMPLFLVMIYLYLNNYCLNMDILILNHMNIYIYMGLIMGFLIKLPMYFMHLWLPKAHVEAPIVGSMILAGIMLKLGSYGLMRIFLTMIELCIKFNKFIVVLSLLGGVISSLICLCQIDLKMLIAYSSIVHMSILLSGLMTMFNMGYIGGYLMMISHGLCSSGMFFLLNISYDRLNSRSLYINKGLINYFPSLSLMWFLMCSSNLSFPFSLNLFSEILLFNSLLMWNKFIIIVLFMFSLFSAFYSLYLYSYSQHGKISMMNLLFNGVKVIEFMILLMHWIPLNLMFIYMYMFV